jgi:hypothetical protein
MATTATAMAEAIGVPEGFKILPFNEEAEYAWHQQWRSISHRVPPRGGWDWPSLRWSYRNDTTTLAGSMWVNDELLALFLGRLNNRAARLDYLEASPQINHPLTGKALPLAIEVGARYAQKTGRRELWLMEPRPAIIAFSKESYGFEYVEPPGKTPFCRREV